MENNKKTNLLKMNLEDVMSSDFGKYAKYIIQDRALPDIRDGLKPVQRRIIYAMNNLNLRFDAPHKKSARTVGEVIGKYHPHGDTSIYEAMVRMSQNWKNNAILIDMHGNNGSIDGDGPAAMRYTECRLSRFGQTMTENIDKNTVEFVNNFDDSDHEPTVLPTLLPNLLINGANGIAAGYATNIPPFNLNEVIDAVITRIDSPNCHLKSILNVMPGPDFPTGGIILNQQGIIDAYNTGKGKINIRANIEQISAKQINITSIPYETNKSLIVRQIDEIKDKYDVLGIKEVRDESDKNGVCIVIETTNGKNFEIIKNILYKKTQLQISYAMNMVAICDHKPVQFPILLALDSFIKHANNIVISSSQYDLDKALKRQEIVVGLIKAIKIIDDVIDIIRKASNKDDTKLRIINNLQFTSLQAEAIVNLKLYRLSNTDVSELNKELLELGEQIEELKLLINNPQYRNNYLKGKLREFKKIFNAKRLSSFSNEEIKIQVDELDTIEDKDMIVICSRDGYLKSLSKQTYSSIEYNTINVKQGDLPVSQFISNQRDKVVLITSKGNYINIPTYKIDQTKWKDIGSHINKFVNVNGDEKIICAFNYDNNVNDQRCLILASKKGQIKRTLIKSLNVAKNIKSSTIMNLDEGDELVSALILNSQNTNVDIGIINSTGIGYKFNVNLVSVLSPKASGVKSMNLAKDEFVAGIVIVNDNSNLQESILMIAANGMKRIHYADLPASNRPSVGKSLLLQTKSNPVIIKNIYSTRATDMIQYVDDEHLLKFIKSSDVPIGDRDTRISKVTSGQIENANIFSFNRSSEPVTSLNEKPESKKDSSSPKTLFDNENN